MDRHRLALVATAVFAQGARADASPVHGNAGFALYQDDDRTSIWTPYGAVGAEVGRGLDLEADYAADVISSASADVITAATGRMTELRQQIAARATWEPPGDNALEGGYAYSFERDSFSHVADLGARRSFLKKNLELSLAYGVSWNGLGVRDQPRDEYDRLWVHNGAAAATVVLGRRTTVALGYEPYLALGYQSNPYRRVPVGGGGDLVGTTWFDENVPDRRLRHAVSARMRRAIGERWAVMGDYRFYADDWGVMGHAVEAAVAAEWDGLVLRARDRMSIQNAAEFYRTAYDVETEYLTRDRRLGPMLANMGGAAASWETRRVRWLDRLAVRAGADMLALRHDGFLVPSREEPTQLEPLGWVLGWVAQVGLEVER